MFNRGVVKAMRSVLTGRNPQLLVALSLAFVYHGGLLLSGTFKRTYDAYIHVFLADHYARFWFDNWDYRWYTGFTLTSYPPGSQQTIALLSYFIGLLNGFIVVQMCAILFVVVGVYRFSKIWVSREAAGYAAILAVFSSSISETVHVFGQLPTMFSLGFLLNALPFVKAWLETGSWKMLITAWLLNAGTTAGHHVTTLFGAIFFVAPVIVFGIVEKFRQPLPDEGDHGHLIHPAKITRKNVFPLLVRRLRRIVPVMLRTVIYGPGLIMALVLVVLPYWLWSKDDPITQVSIPHASRDSFIANPNAGIVFWLLPYGLTLIALPYAFYKGFATKAWPLALSLGLAFFLGTGGTTPFPKMILLGAYNILTLDRFTFWATIIVLPLLGEFVVSMRHRGLAKYIMEQFGLFTLRLVQGGLIVGYLLVAIISTNFTQLRKFQPTPIDMQPIVNFLDKDQHTRWRYLTLGFGDQMAWLSAQTLATTVDGNYHSARRLPEMTTTSVERLEGAKFRGIDGIGSLQQFLAVPEKYNLKFIFSNDQFYDPLLYFSGWHRLQLLENGIMVWEREDIPPLPEVLPRKEIPIYQRIMWGIIPMSAILTALMAMSEPLWGPSLYRLFRFLGRPAEMRKIGRLFGWPKRFWHWLDKWLKRWSSLPDNDDSNEVRWQVWLDWLQRLPHLKPASPTAQQVRSASLIIVALGLISSGGYWVLQQNRSPVAVVQAYYDDLDFRRFSNAYARLDPLKRPAYDQYLLGLSVKNGLVASYGKLDSVKVQILTSEPDQVVVQVETVLITSLNEYPLSQRQTLVKRSGEWYIVPEKDDPVIAPDQFFRVGEVSWRSQGRRQVTTGTTSFNDILDRPQIQILSARLVKVKDRYSVVGELINTDVNPADITVTASLFDEAGNTLTTYNAQSGIIHKLFPKEATPFRVDFEGVAGSALFDLPTASDFKPGAYSPLNLKANIASFDVYAKAVVTTHDLFREVGIQQIQTIFGEDGQVHLSGQLLNSGTREATIPHLLITYYDANNRVVWVDQNFMENAIRPQLAQPFDVKITPLSEVTTVLDKGDLFTNVLQNEVSRDQNWQERISLPPGMGYSALRVSVHYFTGGEQ